MKTRDFYEILFDDDECTCFSPNPFGVRVEPIENWLRRGNDNFVCINPLWPDKDLAPSRPQHSEFVGRRADVNVTVLRNILCEFDKGEISEQRQLLETSGVPYSTLVFSGGKSLHAIISLEEPCNNKQEYDRLVRRIYAKLPGVDRSAKNPSRFTRAPGVLRGDVRQELLDIRPRTSKLALEAWLGPELISEVSAAPMFPGQRILRDETNHFLSVGSPEGGWNNALFKAAADMTRSGYSREEIVHLCGIPTGYLDEKDLRTIDSAIRSSRDSSIQSSD